MFLLARAATLALNRDKVDLGIKTKDRKLLPYRPLYPLSLAELKALRDYLQENLKKGFIWPLKSLASTLILFIPKKDGRLWLYIDY